MKRDVLDYVRSCQNCLKVKAERQKPGGMLQPLPIPEWKWEEITMDFLTNLPKSQEGFDTIWVIVDRLTKSAHFIPIKVTYSKRKLAEVYLENVVKYHGVPLSITSDRDTRFTAHYWRSF